MARIHLLRLYSPPFFCRHKLGFSQTRCQFLRRCHPCLHSLPPHYHSLHCNWSSRRFLPPCRHPTHRCPCSFLCHCLNHDFFASVILVVIFFTMAFFTAVLADFAIPDSLDEIFTSLDLSTALYMPHGLNALVTCYCPSSKILLCIIYSTQDYIPLDRHLCVFAILLEIQRQSMREKSCNILRKKRKYNFA